MAKSGQKVEVTLEDLWVLWSKGRATGLLMAKDQEIQEPNEFLRDELHRDCALVVGRKTYLRLFQDGPWDKPELTVFED